MKLDQVLRDSVQAMRLMSQIFCLGTLSLGCIVFEVAKQNHGKFLNLDQNFKAKPSVNSAQLQILRPNLVLLMQNSIFSTFSTT